MTRGRQTPGRDRVSHSTTDARTPRLLPTLWAAVKRNWPSAFLVASMGVVRYFHSPGFGLYEDDLTFLPGVAQLSIRGLARSIEFQAAQFGQGRPLQLPLMQFFSNLGWRLGEIQGEYVVGYALIAINVVLFYKLIERVHSRPLGILAGLAYVLYSADTTQAYLTLSFSLQPSLTFLLLALHTYLRGRNVISYGLMIPVLLIYETPFSVFAAAPLLFAPWDRPWRKRWVTHLLILAGLLAADLLLRRLLGEDRVGNLTASESFLVPLVHMLEGPPVALATYLYRPLQVLQATSAEPLLVSGVTFGFLFLALRRLPTGYGRTWRPRLAAFFSRGSFASRELRRKTWAKLPDPVRSLVRLIGAGVLMLILAYPFTFTVRAYAISGRDTRVHAAGVVGAALLMGALALLALWLVERSGIRRWAVLLLAGWLGLMAGFGFVIQRDYVRAWQLQRDFWSRMVRLLPDVDDGTVILVDPQGLEDTRQIGANYWNLPRVLEQLYVFPTDWETPPRAYRLEPGWEDHIRTGEGHLRLDVLTTFSPPSTLGIFDPANAILILTSGGDVSRISGPFPVVGGSISFRQAPGVGEPPFPRAFLSHYLILDDATQAVGRSDPNPMRTHRRGLAPRDRDPQ